MPAAGEHLIRWLIALFICILDVLNFTLQSKYRHCYRMKSIVIYLVLFSVCLVLSCLDFDSACFGCKSTLSGDPFGVYNFLELLVDAPHQNVYLVLQHLVSASENLPSVFRCKCTKQTKGSRTGYTQFYQPRMTENEQPRTSSKLL